MGQKWRMDQKCNIFLYFIFQEIEELNKECFLTAKPVTYLVNLTAEDFNRKKNKWLPKIAAWVKVYKFSNINLFIYKIY